MKILFKKNTILLSKYFNFYLKTRKNSVVIKKSTYKHLSLNVKIQTNYTTQLEFCTLYDVKEKKKIYNVLKDKIFL